MKKLRTIKEKYEWAIFPIIKKCSPFDNPEFNVDPVNKSKHIWNRNLFKGSFEDFCNSFDILNSPYPKENITDKDNLPWIHTTALKSGPLKGQRQRFYFLMLDCDGYKTGPTYKEFKQTLIDEDLNFFMYYSSSHFIPNRKENDSFRVIIPLEHWFKYEEFTTLKDAKLEIGDWIIDQPYFDLCSYRSGLMYLPAFIPTEETLKKRKAKGLSEYPKLSEYGMEYRTKGNNLDIWKEIQFACEQKGVTFDPKDQNEDQRVEEMPLSDKQIKWFESQLNSEEKIYDDQVEKIKEDFRNEIDAIPVLVKYVKRLWFAGVRTEMTMFDILSSAYSGHLKQKHLKDIHGIIKKFAFEWVETNENKKIDIRKEFGNAYE